MLCWSQGNYLKFVWKQIGPFRLRNWSWEQSVYFPLIFLFRWSQLPLWTLPALTQSLYLHREMSSRNVLRLHGPHHLQLIILWVFFFFLPCRSVQPGKCSCDLISFSRCILEWICQASCSVQASLQLLRRYRALGSEWGGAGKCYCVSSSVGNWSPACVFSRLWSAYNSQKA